MLISETMQNKLWAELNPSQRIRKNLINCLLVEHSRYVYSNDWTGPTRGLDKVLTICDLGLVLLISETVQNKLWAELTPSQRIRKNLINCLLVKAQLTLHKF